MTRCRSSDRSLSMLQCRKGRPHSCSGTPGRPGRRWEEGHIEEWSQISFPDGVLPWAQSEFRRAKDRQASLLGIRDKNGGGDAALPAAAGVVAGSAAALPRLSKL